MINLELPADLRALRVVGPWLRGVLTYSGEADVDQAARKLELALQEICVNVIEHAYAGVANGRIRVEFATIDDHHSFVIVDHGVEFDPSSKPQVDIGHPTVGGYGLFLVDELCDDVTYERQGQENRWTLTLRQSAQLQY